MNTRSATGATTQGAARYMPGFGNDFETEALPGALPQGQNSPQRCPYGLYAEQLSGSPFTAPRGANERSWLYRIRPGVRHVADFARIDLPFWKTAPDPWAHDLPIGPLRWDPAPIPDAPLTFLTGLRTISTCGDVNVHAGMGVHVYTITRPMEDEAFINADGEMLLAPEIGRLNIVTEFGAIEAGPGDIVLLPRGMAFRISADGEAARGYVCENHGAKFTLPYRGPIGANCLANPRDFRTPVAAFEDRETPHRVTVKWCGRFFACDIGHSPFDVVAWHGNYAPCKYDLRTFSPVGAIAFDHPDPSIFTVLTAPSGIEGTANIDFVIFPERWMVAEHSFRPPWYHRNIMSEFMGLIHGVYDARPAGFVPGGMSLHNCMLPHGPDADAFYAASTAELAPRKLVNTLAFMFETRFPQHVTKYAAEAPTLQTRYPDVWSGLRRHFDPARPVWDGA